MRAVNNRILTANISRFIRLARVGMATKRVTRSAARAALDAEGQSRLTEFYNVRTKLSTGAKAPKTRIINASQPAPTSTDLKLLDIDVESLPIQVAALKLEDSPDAELQLSKLDVQESQNDAETPNSSAEAVESPESPSKSLDDSFSGDNRKYSNLARLPSKVRENSKIDLPKKFSKLYDVFKHLERITQFSLSMDKRILLEDVRAGAEKHLKKVCTTDHFAQLLYIYPESYSIRLEPLRLCRGVGASVEKYEFVIEPNLKSDVEGYLKPLDSSAGVGLPQTTDHKPKLEGWRTQCRCYILKHKMVEYLKKNKEAAKIPSAAFPQPPKPKITIAEFKKEAYSQEIKPKIEEHIPKMSLLERLKAKQAQKQAADEQKMVSKPLAIKKSKLQEMITRNLLYSLEQLYRSKNRTTLALDDVAAALARNCHFSSGEMTGRLQLLVEVAKDLLEYGNIPSSDVKMLRWKGTRSLAELIDVVKGEIERISKELSA